MADVICISCGSANSDAFRYCMQCGATLRPQANQESERQALRSQLGAVQSQLLQMSQRVERLQARLAQLESADETQAGRRTTCTSGPADGGAAAHLGTAAGRDPRPRGASRRCTITACRARSRRSAACVHATSSSRKTDAPPDAATASAPGMPDEGGRGCRPTPEHPSRGSLPLTRSLS